MCNSVLCVPGVVLVNSGEGLVSWGVGKKPWKWEAEKIHPQGVTRMKYTQSGGLLYTVQGGCVYTCAYSSCPGVTCMCIMVYMLLLSSLRNAILYIHWSLLFIVLLMLS